MLRLLLPQGPLPRVVLASASPYRRELLGRLQLPFDVIPAHVDETPLPYERPAELAVRLAARKASKVLNEHPRAEYPGLIVIGSDQVAVCKGRILHKPGHRAAAEAQLAWMSGQTVSFHSGLVVKLATSASSAQQQLATVVDTTVRFRNLRPEVIATYCELEPSFDCVGSAKAEGLGISLIESISSDDPTALIGLPLIALSSMLQHVFKP